MYLKLMLVMLCIYREIVKTEADSNESLSIHMMTYQGRICVQCVTRYGTKGALTRHSFTHTGKFKCAECGTCCQSSAV